MGQDERRLPAEGDHGQSQHAEEIWNQPLAGATPPTTAAPVAGTPIKGPSGERGGAGRAVREIVETLLLALVIFLLVRLFVANFRVEGESMAQSLDNGQMLLVNANSYHLDLNRLRNLLPGEDTTEANLLWRFGPPERGDIIVFTPPEDSDKPYIKRVIGIAGDEISFPQGGGVMVNGQLVDEPYLDDGVFTSCARRDPMCQLTVPPDEVYVLGDNRDHSQDSRVFGPVEISSIIGKAWLSYWPVGDIGLLPHYDYPNLPGEPVSLSSPGAIDAATPPATPRAIRTPRPDRTARPDRTPRAVRATETAAAAAAATATATTTAAASTPTP